MLLPVSDNDTCSTCCSYCRAQGLRAHQQPRADNPFSLKHLLSAGTIVIPIHSDLDLCEHYHAEDGWHSSNDLLEIISCVTAADQNLIYDLALLTKHNFLTTCFNIAARFLVLRVYLIPHDLPNLQGRLRKRDEITVMRPSRKALRAVLRRINADEVLWRGTCEPRDKHTLGSRLPNDCDHRSLSEIYSSLTVPSYDAATSLEYIPGLRSQLYKYQQESVASMLLKERRGATVPDSLYLRVTGTNGEDYYYQPATMEILKEQPVTAQIQGGFLCEELGTGKTVMILALILVTLHVLPQPPESFAEDLPVHTPLSYSHFPPSMSTSTRSLPKNRTTSVKSLTVPSLVEILTNYIRTHPDKCNLADYEDQLEERQLLLPIRRNNPFYLIGGYDTQLTKVYSDRRRKKMPPRIMYLSAATLVVVPENLMSQWQSEILKHCSTTLRVLTVGQKTKLPGPAKFASDYDIILMPYLRVSLEADKDDVEKLHTGYTCRCPFVPDTRIPDCNCPTPPGVSPFLQVHWKRVVRDEGHNSATRTTNFNSFLAMLSAERRWIVTGTPTTNLLGLDFGKSSEIGIRKTNTSEDEEAAGSSVLGDSTAFPPSVEDETPDDLFMQLSNPDTDDSSNSDMSTCDTWNNRDRGDLHKLGSMMASFLRWPRFVVDPDAFGSLVSAPLFEKDGPLPGSIQVLRQVMESVMIRHKISDIERDVILPPVQEETVLLDLDPYALKTFNIHQAMIAVNAVDSERRDMDYLFHPRNQAALAGLIENMSLSLFWRVDADELDIQLSTTIHRAEGAIKHATERNQPQSDILLVREAISYLQSALSDPIYRALQHGLEVPYRISQLPPRIQNAWACVGTTHHYDLPGLFPIAGPDGQPAPAPLSGTFIYPFRALKLREAVTRQPLLSEDKLIALATAVRDLELKRNTWLDAREAAQKRGKREKERNRSAGVGGASGSGSAVGPKIMEVRVGSDARVRRAGEGDAKLDEIRREFVTAQERLKALAVAEEEGVVGASESAARDADADVGLGAGAMTRQGASEGTARSDLLRHSLVAPARIGNTTSSKLNYILNEVRQYAASEKILIFSRQPLVLAHVADGLEMLGVKFLLFTSRVRTEMRQQSVTTFETSETFRVFLMELKLGARGLNLVTASRVIFCEPVWQADVESQAIKRVHRIGQTRPVTVKTLAIRSTFEEAMIRRRRALKGVSGKLPGMADENGIRGFLQNPTFVTPSEGAPASEVELDIPLVFVPHEPGQGHQAEEAHSNDAHKVDVGNDSGFAISVSEPSPHRKRSVSFANEREEHMESAESDMRPAKMRRRVVRFLD